MGAGVADRLQRRAAWRQQAHLIPTAVVERKAGLAAEEDQEAVGGQQRIRRQGEGRRAAVADVVQLQAAHRDGRCAGVEQFDVFVVFVQHAIAVPIHGFGCGQELVEPHQRPGRVGRRRRRDGWRDRGGWRRRDGGRCQCRTTAGRRCAVVEPVGSGVGIHSWVAPRQAVTGRRAWNGRIENAVVVTPGEGVHQPAGPVEEAQQIARVAQAVADLAVGDADDGCGDGGVVRQKIGRAGGQNHEGGWRQRQIWQKVGGEVVGQRPAGQPHDRIAVVVQLDPFPGAVAARFDAVVLDLGDENGGGGQGGGRCLRLVVPEVEIAELAAVGWADGDPVRVHHHAPGARRGAAGGEAAWINFDDVIVGKFGQRQGQFQAECAVRLRQAVEEPAVPGVGVCACPQLHGDAAQRPTEVARLAAVDGAADDDGAESWGVAGARRRGH